MSISKEAVIWAYKLFLNREPESEEVIKYKIAQYDNLESLRNSFFDSKEFISSDNNSHFNKLKIAFFHVPKCAGTEITQLFTKKFGKKIKTDATYADYFVTPSNDLLRYNAYAGHITYDCLRILPKDVLLITILRNPAKRLLSLYSYYHSLEVQPHDSPAINLARELDFHDWLDAKEPDVIVQTSNAIIRQFVPDRFFFDKTPACPENMLTSASSFISEFAVVGFVEGIDLVKKHICELLSITYNPTHGFANKSNSEAIKYDKTRLRKFLLDKNKLDLPFLELCFKIFHKQFAHYGSDFDNIKKKVWDF